VVLAVELRERVHVRDDSCFYRADSSREWQHARGETMMVDVAAWKSVALPILESYSEATDGSFVQDKESAVVWHFNDADPDFGQWQSKVCVCVCVCVLSRPSRYVHSLDVDRLWMRY
jgi:hypothetical protein